MRTLLAHLCIAGALCLTGVAQSQQGYGYGQSQRGQGQAKSPFAGVLEAANELSEALETSGEEWAEVIELLDEQYGDYAEDYSFEEEVEISEDELPEIEETFGLDAETLDELYMAAVEVDWRFETIGGELDFLHAFIETGSFPEEREDTNAQILEYVEQLRAQIDQTSEQWQNILADFDRAVEGRKPQVDQGGNPLPTQGQRRRSDISGLRAQGSSDAPSASITRSELETGGWPHPQKRVKHRLRRSTPTPGAPPLDWTQKNTKSAIRSSFGRASLSNANWRCSTNPSSSLPMR